MRTEVAESIKSCGLSPKVVASAGTGIVAYAVTKLALPWDPAVEQAVNVGAMIFAGWLAKPGKVIVRRR